MIHRLDSLCLPQVFCPRQRKKDNTPQILVGNHAGVYADKPHPCECRVHKRARWRPATSSPGNVHRKPRVSDGIKRVAERHVEHFARLKNQIHAQERCPDRNDCLIVRKQPQQLLPKHIQKEGIDDNVNSPDAQGAVRAR